MALLQIENVSRRYDELAALHDVSFSVSALATPTSMPCPISNEIVVGDCPRWKP